MFVMGRHTPAPGPAARLVRAVVTRPVARLARLVAAPRRRGRRSAGPCAETASATARALRSLRARRPRRRTGLLVCGRGRLSVSAPGCARRGATAPARPPVRPPRGLPAWSARQAAPVAGLKGLARCRSALARCRAVGRPCPRRQGPAIRSPSSLGGRSLSPRSASQRPSAGAGRGRRACSPVAARPTPARRPRPTGVPTHRPSQRCGLRPSRGALCGLAAAQGIGPRPPTRPPPKGAPRLSAGCWTRQLLCLARRVHLASAPALLP